MNEITLTPNRRLSATLHKLYSKQQQENGESCWRTPDILPLTSWLQKLWQQYCAYSYSDQEPYVLNAAQEQFIWEQILLNSRESDQLLQVQETAELVKSAYTLLKQWRVDATLPIFKSAEDYAALTKWILEYEAICRKNNWIDQASLPDILPGKVQLPSTIKLNGFTELSPQMQHFFDGCTVSHINSSQTAESSGRITLADSEEELLTIARWAKAMYVKDKAARIACVIPELEKNRDRVAQVFAEVFADEEAYNISAGKPLIQYPLVDTALQLLSLHRKKSTDVIFSYLLTSPFIGDAENERAKRGAFDVYLRKANISTVDLDVLQQRSLEKYCPKLYKRISQFLTLAASVPQPQSYKAWAYTFNELLSAFGWPGERSLSSVEYQIVESWLDLLNKFSSLDQVAPLATMQQALSVLQKMAAKEMFQHQTPETTIQVLGVLEAAGIPFDYVWMAGMNDIAWPPQPKPNPFIPKSLQRELNMPHATAEREFMFCSALIQQFKSCAKQLIFSHARRSEDLEFKCSPLIHVEHEFCLNDLKLPDYISPGKQIFESRNMLLLVDNKAPSISAEKMSGGVSVIKYQAACPFRAFAEYRLHAKELESTLPGLRAKDRGNLMHKVMELIWAKLIDHHSLSGMAEEELKQLISVCIEESMASLPESHTGLNQYIQLEKLRLQKIVWDWLVIEKSRPPFRVLQNEAVIEYKLQQLSINLRIDRIDELSDGKKLIIDYKTGNNNVNDWFDTRLDEPQLPLYALVDPDNTIGICFAQIAAGKHGFEGLSQYDLEIKGIEKVTESWQEQLATWQQNLAQLADDFSAGNAVVDPKKQEQTCKYCALEPLCRKNEEILSPYGH